MSSWSWLCDHYHLVCFIVLAFLKYFRLVVNCIAYICYRPIPVSDNPKYTARNVTNIIPALLPDDLRNLKETVFSSLRNGVENIIIVTIDAHHPRAQELAKGISPNIKVLSIKHPNKRNQMLAAIPFIETDIVIFTDDDVTWPATMLPWVLAPFENPEVGGVGTSQRLQREERPNFWNFLGAAYLLRRNWDIISCNTIDGGLPCLSGRTVAYRTEIVKNDEFLKAFDNEKWRDCILTADDDNFLTRWLIEHGWHIKIQKHRDCEIETTLEGNSKYLKQCLRWARSNWRSNWKSLREGSIYRRHPWSTFAVFQTTITSWALPWDALMLLFMWQLTAEWTARIRLATRIIGIIWIVFLCRLIKYLPHFIRYPSDLIYIPLIPLFGYYHSIFQKGHALLTLDVTDWGSREGADTTDSNRMTRLSNPDAKSPIYSTSVDVASKVDHMFLEKPIIFGETIPLLYPT